MGNLSDGVKQLWNVWEIRGMIITSLSLQIILIIFGSKRKYSVNFLIRILVWFAYTSADWVTITALGNMARSQGDVANDHSKPSHVIQAFWVPFLLLHLGGVDTITAYSLEDNELWLRHLLALLVQLGVAFYVFIRSWKVTTLTLIAIPMFVTGIVKYLERICVLRSSSFKHFRNSLLSYPQIDYVLVKEEGTNKEILCRRMKKEEISGAASTHGDIDHQVGPDSHDASFFLCQACYLLKRPRKKMKEEEISGVASTHGDIDNQVGSDNHDTSFFLCQACYLFKRPRRKMKEEEISGAASTHGDTDRQVRPDNHDTSSFLSQAYYLFERSTYLFTELVLDYNERNESNSIIHKNQPDKAFMLIETELGFMYDRLYTKASIVYSLLGILLRCVCFSSSFSAFIAFSLYVDTSANPPIDNSITYVLFTGAVGLEIYAFILLLRSARTRHWFEKFRKTKNLNSYSGSKKRWSRSMAQHNLITFCYRLYHTGRLIDCKCLTWKPVDKDLQKRIFRQVLEKSKKISDNSYDIKECKSLLCERGDNALKQRNQLDEFGWSTSELEFDHSLLVWHIATHLCYIDDIPEGYDDDDDDDDDDHDVNDDEYWGPSSRNSKRLSNYMMYLLIECPFMLPKGIGEIRYRDTCKDFQKFCKLKFFEQGKFNIRQQEVSNELLEAEIDKSEDERGDQNKSVLFDGCKLARQLRSLDRKQKWKMMSEVWVEMVMYAASHRGWKEHAQQLTNGGELITHVCLLMAHVGLSEQYKLQKQYIKRKEVPSWVRYAIVPPAVCCLLACEGIFSLLKKKIVGVARLVCTSPPPRHHPSQPEEA